MSGEAIATGWVRILATPYLRGYQAVVERSGSLRGYRFFRSPAISAAKGRSGAGAGRSGAAQIGFFVGYLLRLQGYAYLNPQVPECLVFVFVEPAGGAEHCRLVSAPESLLRKTCEYIRWLTHRPPRFEFYENEAAVMVRHQSMRDWPRDKYAHFSRNFFIESLAWLVRSGLVRKLLEQSPRLNLGPRVSEVRTGARSPSKRGLRAASTGRRQTSRKRPRKK